MRFPYFPLPQFPGARKQVPFSGSGPSPPMVRRRHLDKKKVLLAHPAHRRGPVHCSGTLGGLPPTLVSRIMRPCRRDPCSKHLHRRDLVGHLRALAHRGQTNDLHGAPALLYCYGESLLAGMRPKSGGFLLPYWLGPAGSSLPIMGRRQPSAAMLELIRTFLHNLYNVQGLIQWGGTLLVCVIVFVETGLFVGFFLPGDSLLVTAGVFSAAGALIVGSLGLLVSLCAIGGDPRGSWFGRS